MKYLVVLLAVLCLVILSCKKAKYFYIGDSEIRQGTTFKFGSYFIYKDSASGIEDSVWVSNYTNSLVPVVSTDKNGDKLEVNTYTLTGDTGTIAHVVGEPSIKVNGEDFIVGYFYDKQGGGTLMLKPIRRGILGSNETHYSSYVNRFNSMIVLNKVYKNVYVNETTTVSCLGCNDTTRITTYYSSEDGMIKYVSKGAKTFTKEIVRNKIIK